METQDSVTLRLEPVSERLPTFLPGQFTMLYAHGIGEIAISISGDPSTVDGSLMQTIRDVGAVSRALHDARPGTVLGVRGPFGTTWGLESAAGHDVLIVAGGVGLASAWATNSGTTTESALPSPPKSSTATSLASGW